MGGDTYIKNGLLLSDEDIAGTIIFFIRKSFEDNKPMFQYRDNEITVIKTACGTVLNYTLLDESVAFLDQFFEQNAKCHLIILMVPYQSIGFKEGSNNNKGFFDMVACSNIKVYVKSKYTTKELKVFIDGFNGCCSTVLAKKRYLFNQGAKRISFDEQVKTVLCYFLEQNILGVANTDTTAKAFCESTVIRVVKLFMFLRNNLGSLLVNNSSINNYNLVLKSIQSLVTTKVHDVGVKPKSTTVDELMSFLDSI